MSDELQYPELTELIIEPNYEILWYYYVPLLNREHWDGIEYDDIMYDWAELDYRFGVEYNPIPEPADAGITIGIFLISFIFVSLWIKKFF